MHEKRELFFNINEFEKEGKIEKKNVSFLMNIEEEKIAIIDIILYQFENNNNQIYTFRNIKLIQKISLSTFIGTE